MTKPCRTLTEMLLHATFIWAIEFFPPRGTMNGCCKFLEVQKGIEQINERKIHWSRKLPLWIRKCMNQKLVHARSVSVLTFKLLYLRPADTELCGPFGLTRTSVLVLFCEVNWSRSKPESSLPLTTAQRGRRGCYVVLSIDAGPQTSGSGRRSCEHAGDFSMWMLGTVWDAVGV